MCLIIILFVRWWYSCGHCTSTGNTICQERQGVIYVHWSYCHSLKQSSVAVSVFFRKTIPLGQAKRTLRNKVSLG